MEKEADKVYIVGAGISGLIAAYELEQAGFTPVILEKSDAVGGRVRTVHVDGYDLDIGFQVLLSAYPEAQKYLDFDALKLQRLESGAQIMVDRKRYIIGDPLRNMKLLAPTVEARIGSVADKLKVLRLNAKLKKKTIAEIFESPETSTLDYLQSAGFSEKIIMRFFRPFFAGIFLEPNLYTSSRMFEFVYKMFGEGYATIPEGGIGAIAEQLLRKLSATELHYGQDVISVTNEKIALASGEVISHEGVIITAGASELVPNLKEESTKWKSCMCLYFEVDQTTIPARTIALVAEQGKRINNLYGFMDAQGRHLLSATVLDYTGIDQENLTEQVAQEVREYCGVTKIKHIKNFNIRQALPDLANLRMDGQPSETQLTQNIFLAGDTVMNGSLNAAMKSGALAAKGLIEKRQGVFA